MATTTNYGWTTPNDTDLVKDGAAAIRTLGSSIDTTTKNLNPQTTTGAIAYRSATANVNTALPIGTANQVLRVNSGGTAPEWATTADQTPLTTKGDLFGFDTADARIPIGTNGHILTADSTQSLGLKWAAPVGGGFTLLSTTALSGSSTQITVTANSYAFLLVSVEDYYISAANTLKARFNANSGSVYGQNYFDAPNATSTLVQGQNFISLYSGSGGTDADNDNAATITIQNPNVATNKLGTTIGTGGTGQYLTSGMFVYDDSAVISSVTIFPNGGTFSGGSVKIYGA